MHPEWPSGRSALVIPITVTLKDGNVLTNKVEKMKGTADIPMMREEQIERYGTLAKPYLSDDQVRETANDILHMEEVLNVSGLMHSATFGRSAISR